MVKRVKRLFSSQKGLHLLLAEDPGGGGGVLGFSFAGYVPLAS